MRATSKPLPRAGGVEHGVVAGAPGAEAEVVADQHVARAQAAHQHVVDEGLRRLRGKARRRSAAPPPGRCRSARSSAELVAQRGDARRRQLGLAGRAREVVARVRLEGQHARRQAAVPRLVGAAAPAWPGGRGARRRSCRSSAAQPAPCRGRWKPRMDAHGARDYPRRPGRAAAGTAPGRRPRRGPSRTARRGRGWRRRGPGSAPAPGRARRRRFMAAGSKSSK